MFDPLEELGNTTAYHDSFMLFICIVALVCYIVNLDKDG